MELNTKFVYKFFPRKPVTIKLAECKADDKEISLLPKINFNGGRNCKSNITAVTRYELYHA